MSNSPITPEEEKRLRARANEIVVLNRHALERINHLQRQLDRFLQAGDLSALERVTVELSKVHVQIEARLNELETRVLPPLEAINKNFQLKGL